MLAGAASKGRRSALVAEMRAGRRLLAPDLPTWVQLQPSLPLLQRQLQGRHLASGGRKHGVHRRPGELLGQRRLLLLREQASQLRRFCIVAVVTQ